MELEFKLAGPANAQIQSRAPELHCIIRRVGCTHPLCMYIAWVIQCTEKNKESRMVLIAIKLVPSFLYKLFITILTRSSLQLFLPKLSLLFLQHILFHLPNLVVILSVHLVTTKTTTTTTRETTTTTTTTAAKEENIFRHASWSSWPGFIWILT